MSKKMKDSKNVNDSKFEPINFYEKMDKKFKPVAVNPHYDKHKIKLPFRMIIAGASSAMKTNTALNIMFVMQDTFHKIVIVTKNKDEPLYNYLKSKEPNVEIYEGLQNLPELDKEFNKKENSLVVFDDLVLEKNQKVIEEFAIRCRKLNVSMMYITQSWYRVPKVIRQNLSYLILKQIAQTSDLDRILRDYSLGVDKVQLHEIYNYATEGSKKNFLMIDLDADTLEKFRRNFDIIPMHYE